MLTTKAIHELIHTSSIEPTRHTTDRILTILDALNDRLAALESKQDSDIRTISASLSARGLDI